jgi:4-alpha-glucanotransferase
VASQVRPSQSQGLLSLARLYGVQTSFRDTEGRRVHAPAEVVLDILRAMRAPLERPSEAADAMRLLVETRAKLAVEPVNVIWEGSQPCVPLSMSPDGSRVVYELETEAGERYSSTVRAEWAAAGRKRGTAPQGPLLSLPPVAAGYHRLRVKIGRVESECRLICAPQKAYDGIERGWGAFLPLYALRTDAAKPVADFADLEALANRASQAGANVLGTLPLLASFLGQPFDPSPYSPASRLFWNELYLDLDAALRDVPCERAREELESASFRQEAARLANEPLVDYAEAFRLKRRVLQKQAACAFEAPKPELDAYARRRPDVEAYARFRAAGERLGTGWPSWPEPQRSGTIGEGDFDEADRRYHVFGQWQAEQQIQALTTRARERDLHLYLDYPLGVHGHSFDVWRHPELFAEGAAAGAPPDTFFMGGQNWGFPPLDPHALRADGYRQWIAWLRHHMEVADVLRIDHVMGLHRLYWVPEGREAREGAYVRYPAEELYAIMSLESHRTRTVVVGEDLGTVPAYVREAMGRHAIRRMHVVQLEALPERPLSPLRTASLASLNTHDLAPFAAFWKGSDIAERQALSHFDAGHAARDRKFREGQKRAILDFLREQGLLDAGSDDAASVLLACLRFLGQSPARTVLLNLEDLWLETEPQNIPGTSSERPNWRKKARLGLDEMFEEPALRAIFDEMSRLRP